MKPRAHQKQSLAHNDKTDIVFDCSAPGTGKTAVRLWAFLKRHKTYKHKMLVLCPRTIMRAVWENSAHEIAPNLRVAVADAKSRKAINPADCDIYIANHDAVKWLVKQPASFWKGFHELVIDESTAYKHPTSQRSKALNKLAKRFKWKAALTGTPNSRSITDVWNQVYVLDGGKRLGRSFFMFRNTCCVPKQVGPSANVIKWEDREGIETTIFGLLSDIVIRHQLDDVAEIPPMHTWSLNYELTPKQARVYKQMEATQIAALNKQTITAVNAASVATKLQQIASGSVYTDDKKQQLVDSSRYELILDLVQERKHPLVFFLWKHQRDALIREAEKRSLTFAVIDGDGNDSTHNEFIKNYQDGLYDVLFAHPKSAMHGLTLTKGTSIIWASPTYDLEWYAQGSIRQRRMGQTEKTENLVIVGKDTIDEGVMEIMGGKNKRMKTLLDLFAGLAANTSKQSKQSTQSQPPMPDKVVKDAMNLF